MTLAIVCAVAMAGLFGPSLQPSSGQEQQRRKGTERAPGGCFICGNMPGMHTAIFEGADWFGTVAWDACPVKKYSEDHPNELKALCQKIKAEFIKEGFKFTSFKESCPSLAPYCEPPKENSQEYSGEGQPGRAGATASTPPTPAAEQVPGAATTALPHPLKDLRVSPKELAGGNPVSGTVELHQAPGPGGVTVALESSDPELAEVPSQVTVTGGVTSAETGPMYSAKFDIATRAVHESKVVTIRARAGVQTLEARFRINPPQVKSASLDPPSVCDGNNKATVAFELTGPAPSGGITVTATLHLQSTNTGAGLGSGTSEKTVPSGTRSGSMRVNPGLCKNKHDGYQGRCDVSGWVRVEIENATSSAKSIYGSCGGIDISH